MQPRYPDTGRYTCAADLRAALLAAAADAPDLPRQTHSLNRWRPVQPFEALPAHMVDEFDRQTPVHGPTRPAVDLVEFAYTVDGVRSTMTLQHLRPRLLAMADQVRKQWALYGGGPKPADLAQPRKRATVTWPASIVKVWRMQIESGDHVGALLTGENIGAQFYPGTNSKPIILAAPVPLRGLPGGIASCRRDDGRWVVAEMTSGRALQLRGYGTRAAAEAAALQAWADSPEHIRASKLAAARACIVDHAAERATWCKMVGIEDPAAPDLAADLAAEPAADPVPATAGPLLPVDLAEARAAAAMAQVMAAAVDLAAGPDSARSVPMLHAEARRLRAAAAAVGLPGVAQRWHQAAASLQALADMRAARLAPPGAHTPGPHQAAGTPAVPAPPPGAARGRLRPVCAIIRAPESLQPATHAPPPGNGPHRMPKHARRRPPGQPPSAGRVWPARWPCAAFPAPRLHTPGWRRGAARAGPHGPPLPHPTG